MALLTAAPSSRTILTILAGAIIIAVVVGGLYWAQAVFIPLALAILIAFPLAPAVTFIERLRVGRFFAVIVVFLFVSLFFVGIITLVNRQVASLISDLPMYTDNIRDKVNYLGQLRVGGPMDTLERLREEIVDAWENSSNDTTDEEAAPAEFEVLVTPEELRPEELRPEEEGEEENGEEEDGEEEDGEEEDGEEEDGEKEEEKPVAVVLPEPGLAEWLASMFTFLTPLLELLRHVVLALVLVVFILLEGGGLRSRLIILLGDAHLPVTTSALVDTGRRISRYLTTQFILNSGFGVVWGLSLFIVGVEYALLWGILTAVIRYIPFVGATLSAVLPISLSLAQFPGWWQPLVLIVLLLTYEVISNNLIEPWLYGRSIGVSALAVVVSAVFWTFLWGPIGLVLSGPLTVCLVVLGKHVPTLSFIDVLLGESPELRSDTAYYHRLLARQKREAEQLVRTQLKTTPRDQIYDHLLVPAMVHLKRDREQGAVTAADEEYILHATHELLEELRELPAEVTEGGAAHTQPPRIPIMACPTHDQLDMIVIEMLQQVLDPGLWDVQWTTSEMLTAEVVEIVSEKRPALICIGALSPGGLPYARHLCKLMRVRNPGIKILVGRWGHQDNAKEDWNLLHEAGADLMATTLLDARKHLNDWRPILALDAQSAAER